MIEYNDYVAMRRVVCVRGKSVTNAYHSHIVTAVDSDHAVKQAQEQAKAVGHQLISVRKLS